MTTTTVRPTPARTGEFPRGRAATEGGDAALMVGGVAVVLSSGWVMAQVTGPNTWIPVTLALALVLITAATRPYGRTLVRHAVTSTPGVILLVTVAVWLGLGYAKTWAIDQLHQQAGLVVTTARHEATSTLSDWLAGVTR